LPCDAVFEARIEKITPQGAGVEATYTSKGKICARMEFEL